MDLTEHYKMIESALFNLGVNPETSRGVIPGKWSMKKGSAEIWIDLWYDEKIDRAYFQVVAPAIPIPFENKENFFRELLEYNDKMFSVAFTIYNGWAYIKEIREVNGLDDNEVLATIHRIGTYCDKYDDLLRIKYKIAPEFPGPPHTP